MKRRFYSAVTILGLAVGMAFTLLIASYIRSETKVNASLRNLNSQYMIRSVWKSPEMGQEITTAGPLAKALKDNYPGLVSNYYRFDGVTTVVSRGENHFRASIQIGDSTLLKMYGLPLLHGNPATALRQPDGMVVDGAAAMKYFGRTDVLGEHLTVASFSGEKREFTVTGVLEDIPENSVTRFFKEEGTIFMSEPAMSFFGRTGFETWNNVYIVGFVELTPGTRPEDLKEPVSKLLKTHTGAQIADNLEVRLMPVKEVYLQADNGVIRKTITALSLVAAFIMLMAIINFVNISIGSAVSRLREIGVRKVLGSRKQQIIRQFLSESLILSALALVLALVIFEVSRGSFGAALGRPVQAFYLSGFWFSVAALVLTCFTGLMAGIYPAFVLASVSSAESIKGKFSVAGKNVAFRRILLAGQFTVALFVFAAAAFITGQVNFFFDKELGYSKSSLFYVPLPRDWSPEGVRRIETVQQEFLKNPVLEEVSFSYEIPDGASGFSAGFYQPGRDSSEAVFAPVLQTDGHFAGTYEIAVLAGEFFEGNAIRHVPGNIVLNEAAAHALGFSKPEEAIGHQVRMQNGSEILTVKGVVRDFHFASMHQAIRPLVFMHVKDTGFYRYMTFRLAPGNITDALAVISRQWAGLMPATPFDYRFLDETLGKMYAAELRMQKAAGISTVLAVIIVILGVLGVVSMNIARRTRELGIRKVLGATAGSVAGLFLKEFMLLVLLASALAFPLVIWLVGSWLESYAYRIDMNAVTLLLVGIVFGLLVLVTAGILTLKTAFENPVKALRSE